VSLPEAALFGLLQGATEFLPVSSSGHLVLLQHVWQVPEAHRLPLVTLLHLGTIGAVVAFFARRLAGIVLDCVARSPERRRAGWRLVGFIFLGSVPAAVVGLVFKQHIEAAFSSPVLVAVMLLASGVGLFGTRFRPKHQRNLGWGRALLVGLAQAIAILPGISRSGATIATGIYVGLDPKQAFEFSFLLSIPAVLGGSLLELSGFDAGSLGLAAVALGTLIAFISGAVALLLLRRAVTGDKLYRFGFYLWVVGLAALILMR